MNDNSPQPAELPPNASPKADLSTANAAADALADALACDGPAHEEPNHPEHPPDLSGTFTASAPAIAEPRGTPGDDSPGPDLTVQYRNLSERLDRLSQTVEQQLATFTPLCQRLLMDDGERREQARLREMMHERLEAARPIYQLQLLRPVIQRLASMFDLLHDFRRSDPPGAQSGWGVLEDHLRETLLQQGVEIVLPQIGDRFDKSLHFVITTVPTADPDCHERISQVALAGFVHVGPHDRTGEIRSVVIRPARVVTWKHTAPESPAPTP